MCQAGNGEWGESARAWLVGESDQVMGESDESRASAYGARPPVTPVIRITGWVIRWLLGVGDELVQMAVLSAVAVLLFAPALLAVIAAAIGVVGSLLSLVQIGVDFKAGWYPAVLAELPALRVATEVAFAGLVFLALLYSMNVLIAGMIGRRWQHLYLIPGVILSLPALAAYSVAAYLLTSMLEETTGWGTLTFVILFGYMGLDAAILGLLATDLRPPGRRNAAGSALPKSPIVSEDGQVKAVAEPEVPARKKAVGRSGGARMRFSYGWLQSMLPRRAGNDMQ